MKREEMRWKEAADFAISSVRYHLERSQLTAELAARMMKGGDSPSSENPLFTARLDLQEFQNVVENLLEDIYVRAFLAARHLDVLYDHLRLCDYEDAESLGEEAEWTKAYFASVLDSAVVADFLHADFTCIKDRAEEDYKLLEAIVRVTAEKQEAVAA